jgi:hypothetical protein
MYVKYLGIVFVMKIIFHLTYIMDVFLHFIMSFVTIDLVLIDQRSVGKRRPHLMDNVNAKKRWTTIRWCVNKFSKESREVTRLIKERASFIKLMTLMTFYFLERLTAIIVVL